MKKKSPVLLRSTKAARRELARVALVHPPFPLTLGIHTVRRSKCELEITLLVRDTNDGTPRSQPFLFTCALPVSPRKFIRFVEVSIREAVLHEIYESLHVDGTRVRDPHAGCAVGHAHPLFDDMRCFMRARARAAAR